MTKKIWRKARKKPVVIEFREIDDHFLEIETREGKLIANKEDDYLIRGVEGELYPIKKTIFAKNV